MRLYLHALGPRSRFSIIQSIIVELRQNDVTWDSRGSNGNERPEVDALRGALGDTVMSDAVLI
jgi:hypothetical protein